MCIETGRDYRKQRDIHNIRDHLSAPPSTVNESNQLEIPAEVRGTGYRLIKSNTGSEDCCTIFALNAIASWELQVDFREAINNTYPLVNLKEISFIDLCIVKLIYTSLDYHRISMHLNFTTANIMLLSIFTQFPCSSYFAQINVNPNGPNIHHDHAIHVKRHWF